ncbi:MAG: hypothetical protein JRD03_04455 [Deltaproteobacteria bacterium]|nr:hypothetical protein [Deltaproteobacteria bacterium]
MIKLERIPDSVTVGVCQRFLDRKKTDEIRDWVNEELPRVGVLDLTIKREHVYHLIGLANRRGFFLLSPPEEERLTDRLAEHFSLRSNEIRVVSASHSLESVAAAAAKMTVELIEKLSKQKPDLHIGVGGGFTTMLMARKLASLLPTAKQLPTKLTIHALSTGFDVYAPHTAPVAFLSCFDRAAIKVYRIGLFAPAVVAFEDYSRVKGWPGVKEAFDAVPDDGFDIVITSLGSASHPHGDFNHFMESGSPDGSKALRDKGWVGDVQYRPYSIDGPITDNTIVRTVTLLELDDLVALASKPNKHVIVVAGPCGQCGDTRSDAVYPLLVNSRLKLWSRFVMDVDTAKDLLDMPIAQ